MSASLNIDTIRIFLHVLAVTVWIGGQFVMMALVPVLKEAGVEGLPKKAAQAFHNIAWPAFAVAIFTGIWNIFSVDMASNTGSWHATFGIKFGLVILSGVGAFLHMKATEPKKRGMFAGIGFLAGLIAMFLGYVI